MTKSSMEFRPIPSQPGYSVSRDAVVKRHARVVGGKQLSERMLSTHCAAVSINSVNYNRWELAHEAWGDERAPSPTAQRWAARKEAIAEMSAAEIQAALDAKRLASERRRRMRGRPASSYKNGEVWTIGEYREWLRSQRELVSAD